MVAASDSYAEYLEKLRGAIIDCTKKLEELRGETEEIIAEFKKDELRLTGDEQEFWKRMRKVEMILVKTKMGQVLDVFGHQSKNLMSWLDLMMVLIDERAKKEEEENA